MVNTKKSSFIYNWWLHYLLSVLSNYFWLKYNVQMLLKICLDNIATAFCDCIWGYNSTCTHFCYVLWESCHCDNSFGVLGPVDWIINWFMSH